jgi:formylglycine-generating enzyme required for sulfatase activity
LIILTIVILIGVFIINIIEKQKQMEKNREELKRGRQSVEKSIDKMIFVKGGIFKMGGYDRDWQKPIHEVYVDDFYIGKYEVTYKEYLEFLNSKGVSSNGSYNGEIWIVIAHKYCPISYKNDSYYFKNKYYTDYESGSFNFERNFYADNENCPVAFVTWYGAKAYCEWKGGRLPTEAEWEYAARGGNKSKRYKYSGSNNLNDVAWYYSNSGLKTHEVGTKQPNELGIYDMSGNVGEWCSDWFNYHYYKNSPKNNPQGPSYGKYNHVLRGGASDDFSSCSISERYTRVTLDDTMYNGFRLVKCKSEEEILK